LDDTILLQTESGDSHSIKVRSIVEIQFGTRTASATQTDLPEQDEEPEETYPPVVTSVVEALTEYSGSLTLGLDSGFQAGYSILDGFRLPRLSFGINALQLGIVGRVYFPVSIHRVRKTAIQRADEGHSDFDVLLEEVRLESTPFLVPYVQAGTDSLLIPHIGDGLLFRLSDRIYVDLGATLNLVGSAWLSIGVLYIF
jgi:hypothetical protein